MLMRLTRAAARGVTLIEIIVVLTITAMMLAYVVPEVRDWVRNLKVRNAAESLKNGLELARMEALRRNTQISLWMVADSAGVPGNSCSRSSTSPAWVVAGDDPAGQCAAAASASDAPRLVQRSTALENASGLSISGLDADAAAASRVTFNSLGQVQAVAGDPSIQTIDVKASSGSTRRLRVVVERGGAIRMCDRDVASGDPRACPAL